mmetsp:Transcript_29527/g.77697  ORF Transcript_29527/g.77697 Transcript_29527/m.77697 type:complete len:103 (+) Transcript_29527:391-699(+)
MIRGSVFDKEEIVKKSMDQSVDVASMLEGIIEEVDENNPEYSLRMHHIQWVASQLALDHGHVKAAQDRLFHRNSGPEPIGMVECDEEDEEELSLEEMAMDRN